MSATIRIAAAGDVHCSPANREQTIAAFERLGSSADLLLLAGDLTTHGEPEQAAILAEARSRIDMPVYAVLGNHDHHVGGAEALTRALAEADITVLEHEHAVCAVRGV